MVNVRFSSWFALAALLGTAAAFEEVSSYVAAMSHAAGINAAEEEFD